MTIYWNAAQGMATFFENAQQQKYNNPHFLFCRQEMGIY